VHNLSRPLQLFQFDVEKLVGDDQRLHRLSRIAAAGCDSLIG
jgi:hypothetical protein